MTKPPKRPTTLAASPWPLTVSPLPADAEAQVLERELERISRETATLLSQVRAARGQFRQAEESCWNLDVDALPADLGRGPAGEAWRREQLAPAQETLRAAIKDAHAYVDAIRRARASARIASIARLRLLDLLGPRSGGADPEEPLFAVRRILDDFEAEFPAYRGRISAEATLDAVQIAQKGAGRPRRGEPSLAKWEVLARWVAPLGEVEPLTLQKEYQQSREKTAAGRRRRG